VAIRAYVLISRIICCLSISHGLKWSGRAAYETTDIDIKYISVIMDGIYIRREVEIRLFITLPLKPTRRFS
jgi:hypothetical protein